MLLWSDGEACVFGNACGGVDLLYGLVSALDSVDGEDGIQISRNDSKLAGCDETSEILHLEIATRRGNIVAPAVKHCHNRVVVRAECTARHAYLDSLVNARGIIGCRTATRVARNENFVKVALLKIREQVDSAAYVVNSLAYGGSAQHKGVVSLEAAVMTSVGRVGRLSLAHRSLLDAKGNKAVFNRLKTKSTSWQIALVLIVFRHTDRVMEACGMSLQCNGYGVFFLARVGYQQIAGNRSLGLAEEYETDAAIAVHHNIFFNSEIRLTDVCLDKIET